MFFSSLIFGTLMIVKFVLGSSLVTTDLKLKPNEQVVFFGEILSLEFIVKSVAADLHGKFISKPNESGPLATKFHVPLLQECADLNFAVVEKKEKKEKEKFIKKLKSLLQRFEKKEVAPSESQDVKIKVSVTLNHFHCIHALKNVGFKELGAELVTKLVINFPEIMKRHLDLIGELEDFSFLTVELGEQLFEVRNDYLRPFALKNLVESVSLPVLKKLLEMWNFDLRVEDAKRVLEFWGDSDEFNSVFEDEPLSWLLWRKSEMGRKEFPMSQLIEKLSVETFDASYANLILTFIHDSELIVHQEMCFLELIHADLHKNDPIEERYMTPKMIEDLDSRKWDLWYERGYAAIENIKEQMQLKKQLIDKLKILKMKSNNSTSQQLIAYDLLILLQVPLNFWSRSTYNNSRDIENVQNSMENFDLNHFGFTEIVHLINLLNRNYWTVLWKQLEILEIDLVYDEALSVEFKETTELLQLIRALKFHAVKGNWIRNYYWLSQVTMLLVNPIGSFSESELFLKTLSEIFQNQICELSGWQISLLKNSLHLGEDQMALLEIQNGYLEMFRLAPEIMSREEIAILVGDPVTKELMNHSINNIHRLRFLDSFNSTDLLTFFGIGSNFHLDNCEALYTVDPEALAGFLKGSQGAINYPDLMIWWTHPRCWENNSFTDFLAESIPFTAFVKHPKDADILNLEAIINDLLGRIQRNPEIPAQVFIVKWLIHMDWIFYQFFNEYFLDSPSNEPISSDYDRIVNFEKRTRAKLISWLKGNDSLEDRDDLLELVERSPLSYLRSSFAYDMFLSVALAKLGRNVPLPHFSEIHSQFSIFTSIGLEQACKLREIDMEAAVKNSTEKCEKLIEKYFDFIEKQIWLNRLRMVNFPMFDKYTLRPVSVSQVKKLFDYAGAPIHDLHDFFAMLTRGGYDLHATPVLLDGEQVLYQLPQGKLLSQNHKRINDNFVTNSRKILLTNQLMKMIRK